MAVGDLVTEAWHVEYNGLLIASDNGYDYMEGSSLLGFDIRSDSATRFGRHGGTGGRHYAEMKQSTLNVRISPTTVANYGTKRKALGLAFAPIIDPRNSLPLVTMLPDATTNKVQTLCRCRGFSPLVNREAAIGYMPISIRLEHLDPRLFSLTQTVQAFTMPTDTRTINNAGNAEAPWQISIAGPATNPVITNNTTGQVIAFESLVLNGTQVLVVDSSTSTAKINGEAVDIFLSTGFSWWDLPPGNTSITVSATTATTASCTLTTRSAYWMV